MRFVNMSRPVVIGLVLAGATAATAPLAANDWPEWRGPNRDGVWTETGIVADLPAELNVKWRVPVNAGFSGAAVADSSRQHPAPTRRAAPMWPDDAARRSAQDMRID